MRCTDCDAEIQKSEMPDHLRDEHGVMHSIPEATCPDCTPEQPCARALEVLG